MRNLEQMSLWGGAAAPILYVVTVVIAGAVVPGYDHVTDPISALTAAGRPDIRWIEAAFALYNLLLLAFASAGLALAIRTWRWTFVALLVTAGAGLLMWPFPMDMPGSQVSATGMVHIGLAILASTSTIAAILLSVLAWHRLRHRELTLFSVTCLCLVVSAGFLAGVAAALGWPVIGLLERCTIGGFEIWLFVTAMFLATQVDLAPTRAAK